MKNMARLIALTERPNLKVIAVKNKVAAVTNGHMMIRKPLDVPNGFYWPGKNNDVVTAPRPEKYPDLERLRPDFGTHICHGKLGRTCMTELIKNCQEAIEDGTDTVSMSNGLFIYGDISKKKHCHLPLNMLPGKIVLNVAYLDIILKEMLEYASVKVVSEPVPEKALIIGDSWDHCCVIMPHRNNTNG